MLFHNIANVNNDRAFINHLRRGGFAFFQSLMARLPRPLRILDVGGEPGFWRSMGFAEFTGAIISPDQFAELAQALGVMVMP